MVTDNDPVEYLYISRRFTEAIVQQHEAARPSWKLVLDLKGGPLSLGIRGLHPDYINRFDLARRATAAVTSNTGTLEVPGAYVRSVLDLQLCKVVVHIGFEYPNAEVAGFFADQHVVGIGRVFVALFGSIENFTGRKRRPDYDTEKHPSDAAGLYEILNATREPRDVAVDPGHLHDDVELSTYDSFDAAHGIAYRHNEPLLPTQPLDFLAKVHEHSGRIKLDRDVYDLALLGGPVWLATKRPKPLGG
jgi:hypothetical protein